MKSVPALSPAIEPATRAFLDAVNAAPGPQLQELPVAAARAVLTGVQATPAPRPDAAVEDRVLPAGEGIPVRIVRPAGAAGILPAVLYFHGGGWILGDRETHDRLARELARRSGAAVVVVEYSRSPEARYPRAAEEGYAALQYLAAHGAELNLDPARIAVAGDSAGGNLATVTALLAKERGGPRIAFQALFYPVTDAVCDTPSYDAFATRHFLTRAGMAWFWDAYLPDRAARADRHVSPLRATPDALRDLPPALVVTGEYDVLRDEGEAYAKKLIEAGVRTTAVRVLGTIHDFVLLNPLAATPAPHAALTLAGALLREALAA